PMFKGIFIRAPYITEMGQTVRALGYYKDMTVFAREGNIFVASFHPELTSDFRLHRFFIEKT
ncbi:MAG: pyridoxal 5'-phosphate synthase glutaminase subunit PdxT, partial [Candidatus Atribacteria bacterium]|nr:pyridoxal 5'-phosphate synthase glutaminase subunit PdxT [Candidatus Atribacteria bacterium]